MKELNAHLKALLEKRNNLAQEATTEGGEILTLHAELEKNHKSDCPCRLKGDKKGDCTDSTFSEGMQGIETRLTEQKNRQLEIADLDELIDNTDTVAEKAARIDGTLKSSGAIPPVTSDGMSAVANAMLYPAKDKMMSRIGVDFYGFLQKTKLTTCDDVKSRNVIGVETMSDGQTFNRVASFHATFGKNQAEVVSASKSIGRDLGLGQEFDDAMKARRDAVAKSMFTQVPGMSGGDGSLYAPTEVFAGNTGGLCEYVIDNEIDVLPYAPVSFLECIPARAIPKSYVLYARQTLRINNASAVGESVILTTEDNPTDDVVDFRPLKPESEFGFSQAKAITLTFADTLAVSEEFLEDCPAIADAVETQLMENVRQEFYDQIINGDGSTGEYPELVGLLAQVGLSTRVHRGAASFFGNTQGSGGADDDVRETIERAIFDAQAYGYTVDCVLMSYEDYVEMTFLKDELGKRLYTDDDLATIKGAKVRADVRMPAGTALVGAFRQVVQMLIRRAIRLDIGWVDKQFRQDMLTLRATMRGGLLVKAPHALIRITGL